MHSPSFSAGGLEPQTKFSKRRGLDRISTFRRGLLGKRERVTFSGGLLLKDKLVLRMKSFLYFGGSLKNPTFKGGSQKIDIEGQDSLQRVALICLLI